ncbi:MAG: hypothetical protein ACYDCL_14855 [Myxococcales bacterium]
MKLGSALAALAFGAGCISNPPGGTLACGSNGSCPNGMHCASDQTCWLNGSGPSDGGNGGDGGHGDHCEDAGQPPGCQGLSCSVAADCGVGCSCEGSCCLMPGKAGCTIDADCCGHQIGYTCSPCGVCQCRDAGSDCCGLLHERCCANDLCNPGTLCSAVLSSTCQ